MEALFYQTQDLDLQAIAQALVLEYQAKGYEAQQFGDMNNVTVQLRHESTLRTIPALTKRWRALCSGARAAHWGKWGRRTGSIRSPLERSVWSSILSSLQPQYERSSNI